MNNNNNNICCLNANLLRVFSVDRTPPMVSCPADVTFEVDLGSGGKRVNWNEPTVSDNSGYFTLVSKSHDPNDVFQVGITVVIYIYNDFNNNVNSCSFIVSIVEGNTVCFNSNTVFSVVRQKLG